MTTRTLLLSLLGLAVPIAGYAQLRAEPMRVASCHLSDSLLGGAKPDGRVIGAFDSVRNVTMVGTEPERILDAVARRPDRGLPHPKLYGDGVTAERIAEVLAARPSRG